MKKTAILVPAFVLLLVAILVSCAKTKEKTLIIAGNIKIDRESTEQDVNFIGGGLEDLIISPLLLIDGSVQSHPVLLKEVRSLEGGRVWEIEIKENVRFHDGTVLTAKDVAFSIEKRKEISRLLRRIKKTSTEDNKRLKIIFEKPESDISDFLNGIYVYPRHIFTPDRPWRETFLEKPIGSGPFRFKRWLKKGVEFEANRDYFEGSPKIDRIIYISEEEEKKRLNMLLSGGADIVCPLTPDTAEFLDKDPKFHVNRLPLPFFTAIYLNNRSPLFSDKAVRRAVNLAIDRKRVIEKGTGGAGVAAYTPFMKSMLPDNYAVEPNPYDPKEAVRLLNDAGWRDTDNDGVREKNGKKLILTFYYKTAYREFHRIADEISRDLYELGFEVDARGAGYTELAGDKMSSLEYDAFLDGGGNPFNPEYTWGSRSLHGPDINNYSDYSNKEVDSLFEKAQNTKDLAEKKRIYAKVDAIIREDAPAVILYNPVYLTGSNRRFRKAESFDGTPYSIYKIKDCE